MVNHGVTLSGEERLTALLGEQVKSRLPGYRIALRRHPAAITTNSHARVAVIVEINPGRLEAIFWVVANPTDSVEWAPYLVEVRAVLHSSAYDGAITEMSASNVEFDGPDLPLDEVLSVAADLINEELRATIDELEPSVADDLRRALRIFDNDPIG